MEASWATQTKQISRHQREKKEKAVGIKRLTSGRAHQLQVLVPQLPIFLLEGLQLLPDSLPSCNLCLLGTVHGMFFSRTSSPIGLNRGRILLRKLFFVWKSLNTS